MRVGVVVIGIVLLIIANIAAIMGLPTKHTVDGFANYFMDTGRGIDADRMSPFDGAVVEMGNGVSSWRYNAPNEPVKGPFELGPDNLFMFKNNQCKPECCGASLSCDGGCVCTTPEQRQFIAMRGGNHSTDN
jgi:hypothetical protein